MTSFVLGPCDTQLMGTLVSAAVAEFIITAS